MSIAFVFGATILAFVVSFSIFYGIYWLVSVRNYDPLAECRRLRAPEPLEPERPVNSDGMKTGATNPLIHVGSG